MFTPLLWMLLLAQEQVRETDWWFQYQSAIVRATDETLRRSAIVGRLEFERKFNVLIQALARFSDVYRKGQGSVWPRKEAEAVQKAYRDLEKSGLLNAKERKLP